LRITFRTGAPARIFNLGLQKNNTSFILQEKSYFPLASQACELQNRSSFSATKAASAVANT